MSIACCHGSLRRQCPVCELREELESSRRDHETERRAGDAILKRNTQLEARLRDKDREIERLRMHLVIVHNSTHDKLNATPLDAEEGACGPGVECPPLAQTKSQVESETGPTANAWVEQSQPGIPQSVDNGTDARGQSLSGDESSANTGVVGPVSFSQSLPGERPGQEKVEATVDGAGTPRPNGNSFSASTTAGTNPHSGANEVLSAEEISFVATAAYAPGGFMPKLVNKPLKRLCDSHEALRAQLAEAQKRAEAAEARFAELAKDNEDFRKNNRYQRGYHDGEQSFRSDRDAAIAERDAAQAVIAWADTKCRNVLVWASDGRHKEEHLRRSLDGLLDAFTKLKAELAEVRGDMLRFDGAIEPGTREWFSNLDHFRKERQLKQKNRDLAAKVAEQDEQIDKMHRAGLGDVDGPELRKERDDLREWGRKVYRAATTLRRYIYAPSNSCGAWFGGGPEKHPGIRHGDLVRSLDEALDAAPACLRDEQRVEGVG